MVRLWSYRANGATEEYNNSYNDDYYIDTKVILASKGLGVIYGNKYAIMDVNIKIPKYSVTAIIGPSGCGKSTLIRCFNRMNDLLDAKVEGQVILNGVDIYSIDDVVEVRRRVGMVFQKPNPFPMSIYDNVAFGLRINGFKGDMDEQVEWALKEAVLWDEVKDRLDDNAYTLSGGQQQRLCIARALAIEPDVLLMDEPTASLDPIATTRIEQLITRLKERVTIIIITHNIQQAARISDYVGVMMIDDRLVGRLVEFGTTREVFENPKNKLTEDYISGRFG
jgi:phosphate transport system ATP-binding protein